MSLGSLRFRCCDGDLDVFLQGSDYEDKSICSAWSFGFGFCIDALNYKGFNRVTETAQWLLAFLASALLPTYQLTIR